jgi:hypothetical protein
MMSTSIVFASLLMSANFFSVSNSVEQTQPEPKNYVPAVAIFPWSYCENEKGTSEKGVSMSSEILKKLFEERGKMSVQPSEESRKFWLQQNSEGWTSIIEDPKNQPQIPDNKKLLEYGRAANVDFVCSGRIYWHVKSVWVGLGPKTKATATVDVRIIDVKKGEVVLDVKEFKSDGTKAEKWYETAGALFVAFGITLISGGPKTPQIEKATAVGIGAATDDFFTTTSGGNRKIDGSQFFLSQ